MSELSESVSEARAPVVFAPAPPWVEMQEIRPAARPTEEQIGSGCCYWLSDTQINLAEPRQAWFYRWVCEVTGHDGLQSAAAIDVDFDPAFETVVFHRVRVVRDGIAREIDPTQGLDLLRRERDLERAKYDGRFSAHFVIPDVRVGDLVDVAYTTIGSHPTLGGRFAGEWRFDWSSFVGETRLRILADKRRDLAISTWNAAPSLSERTLPGGVVERAWRSADTPPTPSEPEVPSWVRRFAMVRVSDATTWAEVSDVFRGGYAADEPLPSDLEAEAQRIEAETADSAERAVAALRLVQSSLRYQSVSIGDGGFVPRPVARIWASRSGDCKDASRLLATLLQRLGLDAVPALVNTQRGWVLGEELPSLTAFDHCIVRLRLDDRTWWLEPTRFRQGGDLDRVDQARYGWALPLVAGAQMEDMGEDAAQPLFEMFERFELGPQADSPARMTVETTYRGWRADGMRRRLESDAGTLSRDYIDYYSRWFGEVTEIAPMQATDDLPANILSTVERYDLSRPYEKLPDEGTLQFTTVDDLFGQQLPGTRVAGRRWPIDLGMPREGICRTAIHLPIPITVRPWDRTFRLDGVEVTSRLYAGDDTGRLVKLQRSVKVDSRFVPAQQAERYFDVKEEAHRSSAVTITLPIVDGRFATAEAKGDGALTLLGRYAWPIIVLIWLCLMLARTVLSDPQ